jgi:hypothetical protein
VRPRQPMPVSARMKKLLPPMRASRGPFGIAVVEVIPPSTPHVLLPREHRETVYALEGLIPMEVAQQLFGIAPAPLPAEPLDEAALAPEQLRDLLEHQARKATQPAGWGDRTYQSISGLRWRCCGHLFEDGHSPWCATSGELDPLPE